VVVEKYILGQKWLEKKMTYEGSGDKGEGSGVVMRKRILYL
jgi:hypothetical protein